MDQTWVVLNDASHFFFYHCYINTEDHPKSYHNHCHHHWHHRRHHRHLPNTRCKSPRTHHWPIGLAISVKRNLACKKSAKILRLVNLTLFFNSRKSVMWSAVPVAPALTFYRLREGKLGQRLRRGQYPMHSHMGNFLLLCPSVHPFIRPFTQIPCYRI